jgi:hypothetical protein
MLRPGCSTEASARRHRRQPGTRARGRGTPAAKSNKRRKQDQAKAAHKRAEQARRKERDQLARQAALAMQRLLDPQTPPAEVAALVTHALPDVVYLGAHVAQRRRARR